tara:strand:+ start:425 stop:589 length:165 start_codon:yes stop_codon:yes gene_type:complete
MSVKIMILAEELKTSLGTFYKGACVEVTDSVKLQKLALAGDIEYCNPAQTGLFD